MGMESYYEVKFIDSRRLQFLTNNLNSVINT